MTYALNCPGMGNARPGMLDDPENEMALELISKKHLDEALARDGLREITEETALNGDGHYVAVRIWTGEDFHFYRRDEESWSHKFPGSTPAFVDDKHQPIHNPRTAALNASYYRFAGYWELPEEGILYVPCHGFDLES